MTINNTYSFNPSCIFYLTWPFEKVIEVDVMGKMDMNQEAPKENFVIEQLDEALEERQNPDRRQNTIGEEELGQPDRRKSDRRTESK